MIHILHIGPQKTASSLIHSLVYKKIACDYAIKENFYFQQRRTYSYRDYLNLFPSNQNFVFDCSPSYFSAVHLIEPISRFLANPTIIIGLRNIHKLFSSFAKHQYSLGLLSRKQLESSQFPADFFDPVRYSLHAPSWLSGFDKIGVLNVDLFLTCLTYRLRVMNILFPSLNFQDSDLNDLQVVNEAHSYKYGLGHLRRITPYINLLPFARYSNLFKKSLINYLPTQSNPPTPNLSSPETQSIIKSEIQYCATSFDKFYF
jgi:hypothetical protein